MKTSDKSHAAIYPRYSPKRLNVATLPFIVLILLFMGSCKKDDDNPPSNPETYDLAVVTENLVSPINITYAPDDSHRLFIVDQVGKVWIINADGTKATQPFIDITNKMVAISPDYDERGLLGLAFHPQYASNGKFYLFYTAPPNPGGPDATNLWNNLTRISEFTVSSDAGHADAATERVILESNHPQMNHDGGTIAFGPDGYLYISIGDGGNKNDIGPGHVSDWYADNTGGNGQDIEQNLLGNILRIDVNSTSIDKNYAIPADNPFVGTAGLDEIYAYGFRNPYRFSFDMGGDNALYVGDAGQSLYEEIDVVTKGGNYGWNVKEGTHCFNADDELAGRAACPETDPNGNPLIDPVIEVPNSANPAGGETISIVGGNIYRGDAIASLEGKYIFGSLSGDFTEMSGKLFVSTPGGSGLWDYDGLALKSFPNNLGQYVKGFGQGDDGEIYVATSTEIGPKGTTGKVYKLILSE